MSSYYLEFEPIDTEEEDYKRIKVSVEINSFVIEEIGEAVLQDLDPSDRQDTEFEFSSRTNRLSFTPIFDSLAIELSEVLEDCTFEDHAEWVVAADAEFEVDSVEHAFGSELTLNGSLMARKR